MIWREARRRLSHGGPDAPSGWRAVIELSRSMETELSAGNTNVMAISDQKTKREMRKRINDGAVSFTEYQIFGVSPARLSASKWFRREKWWVVAFCACVTAGPPVACLSLLCGPDSSCRNSRWILIVIGSFVAWMALSVGVVVWVGSTRGSRFVLLLVLGLVGVPVALSPYFVFSDVNFRDA